MSQEYSPVVVPYDERQAIETHFLATLLMKRLVQMRYDALYSLSQKLTDEANAEPLVPRAKALALIRDAVNLMALTK